MGPRPRADWGQPLRSDCDALPIQGPGTPASLGPAAGARPHGAAWPEGPTAEGRCAGPRVPPMTYQVSRAAAAPGPGAWVARARPQSSEGFLSDSSRDSFMTSSSPSGCRRPRAQSRDSTNREMAATPALSTTAGSDRQGSAGAGAGRTERGVCSLRPPQAPGEGGPGHLTRSCDNPTSTPVSRLDGVLVPSGGGCDIPERGDTVRGHRDPRGCGSPFLEGLSSCNKSRHSAAGGGHRQGGGETMGTQTCVPNAGDGGGRDLAAHLPLPPGDAGPGGCKCPHFQPGHPPEGVKCPYLTASPPHPSRHAEVPGHTPQPSSSLESGQSGWPSQSHVCGTQAPPCRQRSSPAGQGWELQL